MRAVAAPARVAYVSGALLDAADLAADRDAESVRRALHVRVVHDTWGVAIGLEVSVAPGGRAVVVSPGLAHDRTGRERWVEAPTALAVPASPPAPTLALTLAEGEDRADCPGGPPGRAALRWRHPRCVPSGEVPLALVTSGGGEVAGVDLSVRRTLRGLPARIAAGVQPLDLTVTSLLLTQVQVDASAAGLTGTPRWFASLADRSEKGLASLPADVWAWLRGPYLDVRDETPGGFVLDIRFAMREDGFAIGLLDRPRAPESLELAVEWVGVTTPERA